MQNRAVQRIQYSSANRRGGTQIHRPRRSSVLVQPALGWIVTLLFYATLAAFYASYIYDAQLAALLTTVKWIPVAALLGVLVLGAAQRPVLSPAGGPAGLVIVLLLVAAAITFTGPYPETGLPAFISVVMTLATALLLARRVRYLGAEDQFFDIVANVGRVVIVVSFVTAILGLSLGRGDRFSGWTDNPNSLGLLLAPALIILTARALERPPKWPYLHAPFLAMGFYVLLLTQSRAAIGWVAISLIGLWLARAGQGLVALGMFLIALLLLQFEVTVADLIAQSSQMLGRGGESHTSALGPGTLAGREEVWPIAIEKFRENPWGFGLGSSEHILEPLARYFEVHYGAHFHSSYLTALVETGLAGFYILLSIILLALVKGFRFTTKVRTAPMRLWPRLALPWALLFGAAFHATMESWLLSAGNANMLLIWVVIALNFSRCRQWTLTTHTLKRSRYA